MKLSADHKKLNRLAAMVATSTASAGANLPPLPPGEDIYDLMPPVFMSFPWWLYLGKFLLVVLVVYILWRFYLWLVAEPVRIRPRIVESPDKMAQRAMKRLRLSPVWQKRQMKEICETLVYVLKNFLHEKYEIGIGPAATSDEFLQSLIQKNVAPELKQKVALLLSVCDRIKFMGEIDCAEPEELFESVNLLIKAEEWQT